MRAEDTRGEARDGEHGREEQLEGGRPEVVREPVAMRVG